MPIREYKCNGCHRTIETLMRMSDPDILTFEGCTGQDCEIERIFSVCALRCKGIDVSEDLYHAGKQSQYRGEQTITRDFLKPDGTIVPMKPGEYDPRWVGKEA